VSYFQELRNNFWVKILRFFDADTDPGFGNLFDHEFGVRDGKKIMIRDKHPGSAKLVVIAQATIS